MREVRRSAIVPFSPAQMFDLVADVQRYPEFLPWCTEAELLSKNDAELTGRLSVAQGPLRGQFTTRNRLERPSAMSLKLVEGPFSDLSGQWQFVALGDSGCRVELAMQFAFSNPVKDMLMGAVFEQTCNSLVDAFVDRARQIYG